MDNIDIYGWLGYPMQIKINFSAATVFLPRRSCWTWSSFWTSHNAAECAASRMAEFYFKSPMHAAGLYPEHTCSSS